MIDTFARMRGYAQRAVALAHVIDQRLETPASSRMITAARQLLVEMETVEESLRPRAVAPVPVPVDESLLTLPVVEPEPVDAHAEAHGRELIEFNRELLTLDRPTLVAVIAVLVKDSYTGGPLALAKLRLAERRLAKLDEVPR